MPLYTDENSPQPGHHIRVSPSSPQWQRKLEAPLRVIISAINEHPEHQDSSLVILWKTLTLMAPMSKAERQFKPDATAWARLYYHEVNGEFRARLEMTQELFSVLQTTPLDKNATEETLWQEHWNKVIWGNQYAIDQAESEVVAAAKTQAKGSGKGWNVGKGKRHWSSALIHNDQYSPYPFELDTVQVEAVAFCWNEYCDKLSSPSEKINSYAVATYQGKPADATSDDVEMGGADHPAQSGGTPAKASTMPPPAQIPKGKGRGRGPKGS